MHSLSKELIQAYQNTSYVVQEENNNWHLNINQINPAFNAWLSQQNIQQWAFITAYNPYSQALNNAENLALQNQIKSILLQNGFKFWEAYGKGEGDWPAEPSVFIANIHYDYAFKLAQQFKQNAYVYGQLNQAPQLIISL
jgi:hypothetical protein